MRAAMEALGRIAPNLSPDAQALAEDVFEAMVADGYGAFDHAVEALAPALGDEGPATLKTRAATARDAPLTAVDLAHYGYISDPKERETRARQPRNRSLEITLQDMADQQGDVDTWLAQYTPAKLNRAGFAGGSLLGFRRPYSLLRSFHRSCAGPRLAGCSRP
ncbi:hypothetical protein J5474_06775, partial [Sagittula sp. M10.9X]|nr:hypothetical protein [Sagittula salina]